MTYSSFRRYDGLRVALSHDWLTGMRGGERVLELLCEQFSEAELYTLIHNRSAVSPIISSRVKRTSWLQHVPGIMANYRYTLPLLPAASRSLRVSHADLLISTSHCVAKGIPHPAATPHLCYCFTPMRYAWLFYDEYFGNNPLKRLLLKPMLRHIRQWDLAHNEDVDLFVGISTYIRDRIKRCYNRDAEVVYPPVNTERLQPGDGSLGGFDLAVSALVPYKRIDLAVDAYNANGRPLKIVGTGTGFEALRRKAAANIEFLGWQSDEDIAKLYQTCNWLVFPGEEDFGIVPVEVQACGRPVLAFRKGGAVETVVDEQTGLFFDEQSVESLNDAVQRAQNIRWDSRVIRKNAEKFSHAAFLDGMDRCIRMVR